MTLLTWSEKREEEKSPLLDSWTLNRGSGLIWEPPQPACQLTEPTQIHLSPEILKPAESQ